MRRVCPWQLLGNTCLVTSIYPDPTSRSLRSERHINQVASNFDQLYHGIQTSIPVEVILFDKYVYY